MSTGQLINSALETLDSALGKPEERPDGRTPSHQWVQAKDHIEKAVNAFVPDSSHSKNQVIHRSLELEKVQNRANLLEKLAESIQIDPRFFYVSRDGGEYARNNSAKGGLDQNRSKETELLDLKIQCISALLDLINIIVNHHLESNQQQDVTEEKLNAIGVSFHSVSALIFRLSAWCSVGYSVDEWILNLDLEHRIQNLIERFWILIPRINRSNSRIQSRYHGDKNNNYERINELEYGHVILNDFIKPLFMKQASFSNQVNLKTGRSKNRQDTKQDNLFGPTFNSSIDLFNNQLWKIHAIGFWNSVCLLLDRLHQEPGITEIWPSLIPPIITLLEETHPRYRLVGLQLSISLLENAPPHLICHTGINDLLQKSYSNTFGLLNIKETIELLNASFDGNLKLIEIEDTSLRKKSIDLHQANRYNKINRLFYESIFNSLVFRNSNRDDEQLDYHLRLLDFVVTRFSQLTELLHFAIGRYISIIIPYLIESLINFKELTGTNYKLVIKIGKLIHLLFHECGEVLMEWSSRLVIVFACCWQEWRTLKHHHHLGKTHHSLTGNMTEKEKLDETIFELVKDSIIHDVFKSFIQVKNKNNASVSSSIITSNNEQDQHNSLDSQSPSQQQKEKEAEKKELQGGQKDEIGLFNLIHSIHQKHPIMSELFKPFL